jgi:hypothetical protein
MAAHSDPVAGGRGSTSVLYQLLVRRRDVGGGDDRSGAFGALVLRTMTDAALASALRSPSVGWPTSWPASSGSWTC